jgi:hypothetical protein
MTDCLESRSISPNKVVYHSGRKPLAGDSLGSGLGGRSGPGEYAIFADLSDPFLERLDRARWRRDSARCESAGSIFIVRSGRLEVIEEGLRGR